MPALAKQTGPARIYMEARRPLGCMADLGQMTKGLGAVRGGNVVLGRRRLDSAS